MSTKTIYWIVGGVIAVLLVVMVASYDYSRDNDQALDKAQELIDSYHRAGLRTAMSAPRVAQVLGDDGGIICTATSSEAQLGYLKTQIGVGGEFYVRPILLQENVFQGLRLIVDTYCPEHADTVERFISDQTYAS
ncbi:hypothetical protein ACLQ3C_07300 [Gordonia sp. DT30]|uniref:hypothetical protein n=1 Tax=unclassified Gordonia (in: high G+C Gram-positive bacteria) TaxID=2657482 RepID=UPI003CE8BDAC